MQLGWITPVEAGKVELETHGTSRLYAILGLTKVNDGPLSPWLLLQHSEQAGLWAPTPNGDQALAKLRGGNAVEELTKAETILLDVAAGLDHKALALKHYPDDPKAGDRMKTQLNSLRNRHKWLQKGGLDLTVQGFTKVKELGAQDCKPVDPDEAENEYFRDSA